MRTEVVYQQIPCEPVVCHRYIKTPLDMAKCINEYKVRYKTCGGLNAEKR